MRFLLGLHVLIVLNKFFESLGGIFNSIASHFADTPKKSNRLASGISITPRRLEIAGGIFIFARIYSTNILKGPEESIADSV